MLTLNGRDVISAVLSFPRAGAWHADVRVDTVDDVTGPVTIDVDEGRLILKGTVARGGNWQNQGYLRIVGGAGGLRTVAKPKHYTNTTLKIVLGDLLSGAGEALAPRTDAAALTKTVPAWTTAALPTGRLITQLLLSALPGGTWRVDPDGKIWIGKETWPDSGLLAEDYQILSDDPSRAEATIGLEVPLLMPGTVLEGRRISWVEHRVGDPETRSFVWFETDAADDRLKSAIRGVVKAAQAPIDYLSHYFATVVSQVGSRIDVQPTDPRIPSMAGVPLFGGLPHWELELFPGGRVLIGWSGGDPTLPYAHAFDADVSARKLRLLASTVVIGNKEAAQAALMSTPYRAAEDTFLAAIVTAVNAALGGVGLIPPAAALSAAQAAFGAAAATFLSRDVKHS